MRKQKCKRKEKKRKEKKRKEKKRKEKGEKEGKKRKEKKRKGKKESCIPSIFHVFLSLTQFASLNFELYLLIQQQPFLVLISIEVKIGKW